MNDVSWFGGVVYGSAVAKVDIKVINAILCQKRCSRDAKSTSLINGCNNDSVIKFGDVQYQQCNGIFFFRNFSKIS